LGATLTHNFLPTYDCIRKIVMNSKKITFL